ncbi:MAG: LCP family protein [Chloroflexi bacterium]|nr:LCP family protein [Chloroflexota bacterium]
MKRMVPVLVRPVLVLVIAGYAVGGWLLASAGLAAAREVAERWTRRPLVSAVPAASPFAPDEPGLAADLPVWGGTERVSVLLLGIDTRPDEVSWEPGRTDFIAVATLDPATHSAGLISFPRDLWVTIPVAPGYRFEERINVAYRTGELEHVPGGGVAVARRTLEYNFGIRTNFYVIVDFEAVVRAIDRLGGIVIDVERPLKDNEFPTDDYGTKRIYFAPGLQWFDGQRALEYARSRHQDSDFERNRRQQQVLLAARQKALSLNFLPLLPHLIDNLRGHLKTDLTLPQLLALARLGATVDLQDITVRSIAGDAIVRLPDQTVFLPNRPVVGRLIAEVFADPRVRREAAQIVVVAAPAQRVLAQRLTRTLESRGFTARLEVRPAAEPRAETALVDYTGKPATVRALSELLQLDPARVVDGRSGSGAGDLELLVGADLELP